MKKIIIILVSFTPLFLKAQIPFLNLDTTYKAKANETGVLLVKDAAYFPKLANSDTLMYSTYDAFGKAILRRIPTGGSGGTSYTDVQARAAVSNSYIANSIPVADGTSFTTQSGLKYINGHLMTDT